MTQPASTPIRSIRLTAVQIAAISAALAGSITPADSSASVRLARTGAVPAPKATIGVLLRLALIEPSRFAWKEFTATARGVRLGRSLGLPTRPRVTPPRTLRERAIVLRELTMPDIWACGDREAYEPRRIRLYPGNDLRWIESLGYGRFVPAVGAPHVLQLALTNKGRRLVEATDAPITVRLGKEMAANLKRGTLHKVLVPDPGEHQPRLANFQMLHSDHHQSPRDIWARLYDPAAIFPGTLVRLVHARTGRLLATARAGDWNRIWFRANGEYGCPIFDVNFEYASRSPLDQYHERIWVAFPYATDEFAPCAESHRFAAACGFDSINTMRRFWLRRSVKVEPKRKADVRGLILDLDDIRPVRAGNRTRHESITGRRAHPVAGSTTRSSRREPIAQLPLAA